MGERTANKIFDRTLVRARLSNALQSDDFPDFLHRRAAEDILDRLGLILREFDRAVVIADKPDGIARQLIETGRFGDIVTARTARGHAADILCDDEALPFAENSLDCVISLLSLHHANDLPGALIQISRALKPDGLFMAALFGGTTLNELRHAWLAAESELEGTVSLRVAPFADIRDMGGLLQRAGFSLPVVDTDPVTVTYADALSAMREIKQMGLSNALAQRSTRPTTRQTLACACAAYENEFARQDGRVPATFEIFYLTGWSPHESQQQPLKPGSAKTRLADALSTKEFPLKDE
ncbi:MAG: methyltransferase domain-containing protein [Rhizobiales bacterium]|nr:methyltransferase domain-containing protein [Hyphomicrobiales bacterium]